MTETPGGPASQDRLHQLLAAAGEDAVREQRAASTAMTDLRNQVAALAEAVRATASDASVERLGGVVSTVVADLRTSTSLLGQRIEALTKRVDAVAADTAAPTEQAAVRLGALSAEIAAQGEHVEVMRASLDALSGFPSALAALQKDVAGLHDRLQPLTEVRSSLGDLNARTASSLDGLRPQLEAIRSAVDAIGVVPDQERIRDAVVDALSGRLDKIEEEASRPVVGPEAHKAALGDLRSQLEGSTGERFEELEAALGAVENRLGQVSERIADVGDAAGGVPALASEVQRVHTRLDDLQALRDQVAAVSLGVAALQEDTSSRSITLALAALRDDVEHLNERITDTAPPAVEEVASVVSQRVADRLVETLAPRIADVVLTRVSAALVSQLGEALSPRVRADTEAIVRIATTDSERRVLAHLDEAVLALAEALLRRRRGGRSTPMLDEDVYEPPVLAEPEPPQEPVDDLIDRLNAMPEPTPEELAASVAAASPSYVEPVAPVADLEPLPEPAAPDEPVAPVVEERIAVTSSLAPTSADLVPVPEVVPTPVLEAEPDPAPIDEPQPLDEPEPVDEPQPVAEAEPEPEPVAEAAPTLEAEPDVAEPDVVEPDGAEPDVVEPDEDEPTAALASIAGEEPEPAAPEKPSVQAAPKAVAGSIPRKVVKPNVKAPSRKAAPPVKKPSRPTKPILERTPDVPDDDVEPVRLPPRTRQPVPPSSRPPVSRPAGPPSTPLSPAPPQPAERPGASTPPSRPAPAAPPPGLDLPYRPPEPPKRKPWWRPGG